jgi:flagellar operon protein
MKVGDLQRQIGFEPIRPGQFNKPAATPENAVPEGQKFAQLLQEKIAGQQDLKFSAHAVKRLEERQVELTSAHLDRLQSGMNQLSEKGSVNSAVMMDNTVYIVSVKNRTVVTAVQQEAQNVFTNIDSLAIV